MALVVKDRVRVVTTTTGTTDFALGSAVTGYQSFSVIGDGNTTYYAATDSITGDWEVGIGTYVAAGPTLTRDTVLESSNAGSKVVFGAGAKDVFVTYPAERAVYLNGAGSAVDVLDVGTLGVGTANITTANITAGTVSTTPTSGTDIANKTYVDTLVSSGITYHAPVKYEVPNTTGNLNATYNNGVAGVGATLTNAGTKAAFAPDGPTAQVGDRILVYNQTNQFENGVYEVTTVGTPDPGGTNWVLTRAADANSYGVKDPNKLGNGDAFFITSGNTGAGETYLCNTTGTITFGTTAITFVQVSDATLYTAGTGLTLSGTQFSITPVGTAGTYGSASQVPVIVTNASGQVSSVTNTAIAISAGAVSGLAASATTDTTNANNITSGTLDTARISGSYTGISGVGTLTAGTWNASVIAAAYGGTGISSYAVGDLLYADTTTSLAKLPDVVAGNALISGGVGTAPAWGKIGLTTHVSGVLPVVNGGTGTTTPSLVAGTNITISGTWPNQTVNASGGGSGVQVGDYVQADTAPSTGTWLSVNGYYSKAAYPALAAKLGDIPDLISFEQNPSMNDLMYPLNPVPTGGGVGTYISDTDGTKMVFSTTSTTNVVNNTPGGFYTTDGENFLPCNVGPVNELRYLNNKWIACGLVSTTLQVSDDGINWNSIAIAVSAQVNSVAYGNGVYVAWTSSLSRWFVSSDAANWTTYNGLWDSTVNLTFSARLAVGIVRIRFANGIFLAIGTESSTFNDVVMSSTDGITWTTSITSGSTRFYDIVYANSIWVMVGGSGNIRSSPDGLTWTTRVSGSGTYLKVIFANGLFVAIGPVIRTSPDGITWTAPTLPLLGVHQCQDIVWTGSQFIVPLYRGARYLTSPDGVTWTLANDSSGRYIYSHVLHFNGKTTFLSPNYSRVLLGTTPKTIGYGTNNFYPVSNGSFQAGFDLVAFGAGVYVIASTFGMLAYSSDGVTFTWIATQESSNFSNIQYINGYFLAGATGVFYYSTDGINWTRQAWVSSTTTIHRFAYSASSGVYVVTLGTNFAYATSFGSWTVVTAGNQPYMDVTFFAPASLFVAVGNNGSVYTSPDGITWTNKSAGGISYRKIVTATTPTNRLVIWGTGANAVLETTDAVTFTQRTTGLTNGVADVCWETTSGFTAVEGTATNPRVASSVDGITWTLRNTYVNTNSNMLSVFPSGANRIIFLSTGGTILRTPDNGQTWSSAQAGLTNVFNTSTTLQTVRFVNGRYYAFYYGSSETSDSGIETSVDALTWEMIKPYPLNFVGIPRRIYELNGISYITSAQGLHYSTNKINWTRVPTVNVAATHMAYGNGVWLCVTRPQLTVSNSVGLVLVFRSTDGINFSYVSTLNNLARNSGGSVINATDIVFANGRFVVTFSANSPAVGVSSAAIHSVDGITWATSKMPQSMASGMTFSGTAASTGSMILATTSSSANPNSIVKSTDGGQTFTQGPIVQSADSVAYSNGVFFANATFNSVSYMSSDGTNWHEVRQPSQINFIYATNSALYLISRYAVARNGLNTSQGPSKPLLNQEIPFSGYNSNLIVKTGDRLLVPAGFVFRAPNPNYIAELKFYSYNTATTFYVPGTVAGTNSWIYAGP